ncbi:hypothetical protein PR003_g8529 [Phytophthora rubi]|uniref:Uncharacterized protein n=2 Tax=Phytophthora rubi TaxID=129364 RepID=A0A6A4FIM7_9STRA|nr:hypothetical protein PR003_g8529 [Phytophthora rubi]
MRHAPSSRSLVGYLLTLLAFVNCMSPVVGIDGSCYDDYKISFSNCSDAQTQFNSAGCTCYTCNEVNGHVEASCTSPFSCSLTSSPDTQDAAAPKMGNKEYAIICAVYVATAAVLAGAATLIAKLCFPQISKEPSVADLVKKRMPTITRYAFQASLESFVRDDGSPTGFVDYFCDKKELFGVLDCRKKTAVVRPRWMRVCAIVTTLMITISLALLLGTVVYNNESCTSTNTVTYCSVCSCKTLCGGIDIGCTAGCQCKSSSECPLSSYACKGADSVVSSSGVTQTSTINCESASVATSDKANWVTMILTLLMGKAGSMAISTAEVGSSRQKLLHVATASASIALIIFGVLYSQQLTKASVDGDTGANERRMKAVGATLVTGFLYDQAVGFGTVFSQFVLYSGCYYWWYRPQLETMKSAGAAAVHPHGLDDSIMKTDGVKAAMSKPVAVDEVTLQPPTQQQ